MGDGVIEVEPALTAIVLFAVAAIVGGFNAAIGPSGGAMIAVISFVVPPPSSVVLHGITSLFSSGFRSWQLRRHLVRPLLLRFAAGAVVGAAVAGALSPAVSGSLWSAFIGAFVLVSAVWPSVVAKLAGPRDMAVTGLVSTFFSFWVGTGGVIAAPAILNRSKSRFEAIGNQAAAVAFQGALKIGLLLPLIALSTEFYVYVAALLGGSLLGNLVGIGFLSSLTDRRHERLQRAILAVLGLGLLLYAVIESLK